MAARVLPRVAQATSMIALATSKLTVTPSPTRNRTLLGCLSPATAMSLGYGRLQPPVPMPTPKSETQTGYGGLLGPRGALKPGVEENEFLEKARSAFAAGRFDQAFQAYQHAASAKNGEAMATLGFLCEKGWGVTQDYQEALQWYEKSAAVGNVIAMANIGALYENGSGVTQDYQQARQWYEKAATAGNTGAMRNLGHLYESGLGVTQDYEQARHWYEISLTALPCSLQQYADFSFRLAPVPAHNACMDLPKILRLMHEELANLNTTILALERMQAASSGKRRGRPPKWLTEAKRGGKAKLNTNRGWPYPLE